MMNRYRDYMNEGMTQMEQQQQSGSMNLFQPTSLSPLLPLPSVGSVPSFMSRIPPPPPPLMFPASMSTTDTNSPQLLFPPSAQRYDSSSASLMLTSSQSFESRAVYQTTSIYQTAASYQSQHAAFDSRPPSFIEEMQQKYVGLEKDQNAPSSSLFSIDSDDVIASRLSDSRYCTPCQVHITSFKMALQHIQGVKHRRTVEQRSKKEIQVLDSYDEGERRQVVPHKERSVERCEGPSRECSAWEAQQRMREEEWRKRLEEEDRRRVIIASRSSNRSDASVTDLRSFIQETTRKLMDGERSSMLSRTPQEDRYSRRVVLIDETERAMEEESRRREAEEQRLKHLLDVKMRAEEEERRRTMEAELRRRSALELRHREEERRRLQEEWRRKEEQEQKEFDERWRKLEDAEREAKRKRSQLEEERLCLTMEIRKLKFADGMKRKYEENVLATEDAKRCRREDVQRRWEEERRRNEERSRHESELEAEERRRIEEERQRHELERCRNEDRRWELWKQRQQKDALHQSRTSQADTTQALEKLEERARQIVAEQKLALQEVAKVRRKAEEEQLARNGLSRQETSQEEDATAAADRLELQKIVAPQTPLSAPMELSAMKRQAEQMWNEMEEARVSKKMRFEEKVKKIGISSVSKRALEEIKELNKAIASGDSKAVDEANLLRLRVCPLCDVRVVGLEAVRQHLLGRRHKEQVVRRKIAQRVEAKRRKQAGAAPVESESAAPDAASTSEKGDVDNPIILDECGGEEERSDTGVLSVEMLTPTEVVGAELLGKSEAEQAKHIAAGGKCPLCNSQISSPATALQHVKGKRHTGKMANAMSSNAAGVAKMFFLRKSAEEQREELMATRSCRLCEVTLPGSDAASSHLRGKRHLANLAKADPSKGAVQAVDFLKGSLSEQVDAVLRIGSCTLCGVTVNAPLAAKAHLEGKRHLAMLGQAGLVGRRPKGNATRIVPPPIAFLPESQVMFRPKAKNLVAAGGCWLCNEPVQSNDNAIKHLALKSHRNMIDEMRVDSFSIAVPSSPAANKGKDGGESSFNQEVSRLLKGKKCALCDIAIGSETIAVMHLVSQKHQSLLGSRLGQLHQETTKDSHVIGAKHLHDDVPQNRGERKTKSVWVPAGAALEASVREEAEALEKEGKEAEPSTSGVSTNKGSSASVGEDGKEGENRKLEKEGETEASNAENSAEKGSSASVSGSQSGTGSAAKEGKETEASNAENSAEKGSSASVSRPQSGTGSAVKEGKETEASTGENSAGKGSSSASVSSSQSGTGSAAKEGKETEASTGENSAEKGSSSASVSRPQSGTGSADKSSDIEVGQSDAKDQPKTGASSPTSRNVDEPPISVNQSATEAVKPAAPVRPPAPKIPEKPVPLVGLPDCDRPSVATPSKIGAPKLRLVSVGDAPGGQGPDEANGN